MDNHYSQMAHSESQLSKCGAFLGSCCASSSHGIGICAVSTYGHARKRPRVTAGIICGCLLVLIIVIIVAATAGGGGGGSWNIEGLVLFCDDILDCNQHAAEDGVGALIGEWNSAQYATALASGIFVGISPAIGSGAVGTFNGKGTSPKLFYNTLQGQTLTAIANTAASNSGIFEYPLEFNELANPPGSHAGLLFYAQDVEYQIVAEGDSYNQMYAQWAALMAIGRVVHSSDCMGSWPVVSESMVKGISWDSAGVVAAFNALALVDDSSGGSSKLVAKSGSYDSWMHMCFANGWIDGYIAQGYGSGGCLTNEPERSNERYQSGVPFVAMVQCAKDNAADAVFVVRANSGGKGSAAARFDRGVYLLETCPLAELQAFAQAPAVEYSRKYAGMCVEA